MALALALAAALALSLAAAGAAAARARFRAAPVLYDSPRVYPRFAARPRLDFDASGRCAAWCSARPCAVWCR